MKRSNRIVIVGWGAIATAVIRLLDQDGAAAEIVGIAVRDPNRQRPELPEGASLLTDPSELATVNADLVIEAAGSASVAPWARAALSQGIDFVVSSVSALANAELLEELRSLAHARDAQLIIQAGALGGLDALASSRHMGLKSVEHRIVKPVRAWAGTEAESLCRLDKLDRPTAFFSGTSTEAATRFPKNANVALTTALAGVGPDATRITLIADPAAAMNCHEIKASGDFGTLHVQIANMPLPESPKSSAMTALNLVRLIENRTASLVI